MLLKVPRPPWSSCVVRLSCSLFPPSTSSRRDGGNSCPLVKMLWLFPAFPQKIDDDLLRRVAAGIVFGLRDSYSAFKFLPNSVAAAVWSNENFKTAPKHLCAASGSVYDAETAPTDDETTPLNNLPFLGRQLRHDARAGGRTDLAGSAHRQLEPRAEQRGRQRGKAQRGLGGRRLVPPRPHRLRGHRVHRGRSGRRPRRHGRPHAGALRQRPRAGVR